MNLNIFKPQSQKSNGSPSISFYKNGVVAFNNSAANSLGLSSGDRVQFANDQDSPEDWYFTKGSDGPESFELKTYKGKDTLSFNSVDLIESVLESLGGGERRSFQCPIAKEPAENGWYAIFTAAVKKD